MSCPYPLSTTLNKIWVYNPCPEGKKIALNLLQKEQPDEEPIPFSRIAEEAGLEKALWCCRAEPEYEKQWRSFAVWCAQYFQTLANDERLSEIIKQAEKCIIGQTTDSDLNLARSNAWSIFSSLRRKGAGVSATHPESSLAVAWAVHSLETPENIGKWSEWIFRYTEFVTETPCWLNKFSNRVQLSRLTITSTLHCAFTELVEKGKLPPHSNLFDNETSILGKRA